MVGGGGGVEQQMGGVKPCLEARKEGKVSRGAKRMKEKGDSLS